MVSIKPVEAIFSDQRAIKARPVGRFFHRGFKRARLLRFGIWIDERLTLNGK